MGKQRHTAEQIIGTLREAEVLASEGMPMEEVLRQLGISDATYYKWRKEPGGLRIDPAKRLKSKVPANRLPTPVTSMADADFIRSRYSVDKALSEVARQRVKTTPVEQPTCVIQPLNEFMRAMRGLQSSPVRRSFVPHQSAAVVHTAYGTTSPGDRRIIELLLVVNV